MVGPGLSWMFAGGTSGGGGACKERRERPAAKVKVFLG